MSGRAERGGRRPSLDDLERRVSAARAETEARGETFYPGASRVHLAAFPPRNAGATGSSSTPKAWPERVERRYMLVPTTCFNCESACGLLAYVDRDTLEVRKFEGNPEHPGSRGRNCAKGPATVTQLTDPDRILHPLKRVGERGEGSGSGSAGTRRSTTSAARIRAAIDEDRHGDVMYHVGRPGEDGFTERTLAPGAWTATTRTPTSVLGRARRLSPVDGDGPPSPDHARTPRSSSWSAVTSKRGTTSTRTRSASWRGRSGVRS